MLDGRGSISGRGKDISLFFTVFRLAIGATGPPIKLVPGAPSSGVKRPGR
jgi:hypothetical protein